MLRPSAAHRSFAHTYSVAVLILASCSAPSESVGASLPTDTPVNESKVVPMDEPSFVASRIAGDLQIRAELQPGVGVDGADTWTCGPARITTALPVGYPPPTPPGAIELKHYPSVRRAEVSGAGNPDLGRNSAFWPLFGHIQKREIAMTSPVEMDYPTLIESVPDKNEWTMSFLYREASQGELGRDGNVSVVDQAPMTVIAMGRLGDYSWQNALEAIEPLRVWLAGQSKWEIAGPARALYYNGPEKRLAEKWSEIQIPVRLAALPQAK